MSGAAPILLAIETSGRRGGVALRDASGGVHVEWLSPRCGHDDDLLPAIDRLYARAGLEPCSTAAVGVSVGPGGFTGLRIGVATAKMLGESLGASLLAVPSALVAAEACQGPGPIIVALASKRQSAWVTRLRREAEAWAIDGEARLADRLCLVGVLAVVADEYLPGPMREACELAAVPVVAPVLDPAACLSVAARLLQEGRTTDALALEPIYPRPPEAVALWERRPR